jgi:glutamyl-tRNA reductase
MTVGTIGTSIWQQNLPLLEHLTLDREARLPRLERLKSALGLTELVYLATCNRVEVMYAVEPGDADSRLLHRLIDFFFKGERRISFFPNDFYHFTGREAITHLFRMVSSLESLVVGESQITGQFKQAWQEASSAGLSGPVLDGIAQEALVVAKRVKRETDLGAGALSMASLATEQLYAGLAGIDRAVVALVGSGAMTSKVARQASQWPGVNLVFVNRTVEKAEQLAAEFGGCAISLTAFVADPMPIDAIVSATASSEPVFDRSFVDRLPSALRPMLCIDLAVPRDFSPDCSGNPRLRMIDIPRLKAAAHGNLRKKFVEAGKAHEIVKDAVTRYLSDQIEVSLKPIFHESYRESLEHAEQALSELFSSKLTALSDSEREAVIRVVKRLIGQSSFQPVRALSHRLVTIRSELSFEGQQVTENKAVG